MNRRSGVTVLSSNVPIAEDTTLLSLLQGKNAEAGEEALSDSLSLITRRYPTPGCLSSDMLRFLETGALRADG